MPSVTKLSSKGQVIIPKAVRESNRWHAGTEFEVLERPEGILLKPRLLEKRYTIEDAAGCLRYEGPPKTLEDMQAGIDAAMAERWARKSRREP